MKKIITLFFACFLFYVSQAQITITKSDIALPLTQYINYNDTLPSVVPGPAGANQTWDFTGLVHHTTDTIIFTKPEWTTYGTSFPSSDLCMLTINTQTSYVYFGLDNDSMTIVGQAGQFMGSTSNIMVPFNPSQKIIDFPTTYQDGFTNTSSFKVVQYYGQSNIDSIKVKDITLTDCQFDAWGSVTTVLGTYNALRSYELQISNDSVWVLMFGNWIDVTSSYGGLDTVKRYTWWTNGLGFKIVEMYVDPLTDSVLTVGYLAALPQPGGLTQYEINDAVTVFPNPASDMVSVSMPENANLVEVYSSTGQLIKSEKTNNTLVSHVDISGLPSGTYIIRISGNDGFTICHKNLVVE